MDSRKGQAISGIIGTVVMTIVGIILMVGVLTPIASNLTNAPYYYNGTNPGDKMNVGFTGANAVIANNVVTFILIGALLLIIGVAVTQWGRE